ncbi:MAG: hypothetical protein AAF721_31970, partial [Myxococcota bacterium]
MVEELALRAAGRWLLAGALLAMPGCYEGAGPGQDGGVDGTDDGEADGGDGDDDGDGDGADDGADDGAAAQCSEETPPRAGLLRMNRRTYVNALGEVFGDEAVAGVQIAIDALPGTQAGVFAAETAAPTYSEVTATVDIAAQLAYGLTLDDAALAGLSPCLTSVPAGSDPSTDTCLGDFMDEMGRRLLRR